MLLDIWVLEVSKLVKFSIRNMCEGDLNKVLLWRNHPEIRRYMYTNNEISSEDHLNWFKGASKDSAKHLLIFEIDSSPLGFINIQIEPFGRIGKWGFYTAPEAPRGTGRALGETTLRHSFEKLGIHKLCGEALAFNERSIRLHQKLGFKKEGILRQQHFDGNRYQDIVCFGLLSQEMTSKKEK